MTDWLARKAGSIIDFSLPGDPPNLPTRVALDRIEEYYRQLRQRGDPRNPPKPAPVASTPSQVTTSSTKAPAQGRLI